MNVSMIPDRKRIEAAKNFFNCLQSLNRISQTEKLQAISSAIVTLADAATICSIPAQELWFNYVRLGILRMYNGDVPTSEFIKVTILLQNVIEFFCEQERIRRRYEQSYQEIVKGVIQHGLKDDVDRRQAATLWLSKYFNMPQSEAIYFESCTIAISRFYILYPINTIEASYGLVNTVNNGNQVTINNNIDVSELVQLLNSVTEVVSRTAGKENPSTNEVQPSAGTGILATVSEAEEQIRKWTDTLPMLNGADLAAAKLAIEKWRGGSHIDAYKAALPSGCANNPKEFVSKKKAIAERVAQAHGLTMPNWRSKV